MLGYAIVFIGTQDIVVFILILGHQILISGVRGNLCLQTGVFLLGSRTGSNVLGRRTGDQIDLLVLVTVGAFAALDNLDAVDLVLLVLLVLLLNQTHSQLLLIGNTIPNRIRPTRRRAY